MIHGKTRRVSKKVKKMHKEAETSGLLGATEVKKGGGMMDTFIISSVTNSKIKDSKVMNVIDGNLLSLGKLIEMSNGVDYLAIKKFNPFGGDERYYKFKFSPVALSV